MIISLDYYQELTTTLTKGFIDANAHRYIFFNIIDKYMNIQDYMNAGPRHQIGEAKWKQQKH